ncbi:SOS response-associated peptidase [Costertonia aggregata]|uniref:Abasic site processing protein n=1 Tax=Costertonia aggregata TaxID=343403 RepID=A0A7H9AND6_9FLAO|nr:SOS response-associated peptidase family protein [Costertonia aggregata]QLG44969.1 SOS response-associated peptidase family protein [Costertonia aggregata]
MYYKLSNTASKKALEELLNRSFKYPHIYEKKVLINGFEEECIPIVSMKEDNLITPAIWGILPDGYEEEWRVFQNICNTLNAPLETMESNLWYAKSLLSKRCLIPVTGFFTSYLSDGIVYPFYFSRATGLPFCLAGIYTVLEDGFVTCSVITCSADDSIRKVHNIGQNMPVILNGHLQSAWLQEGIEMSEIKEILDTPHTYQIKSHPIAKEFYKNNISYDSMLESVFYDNIPNGFFSGQER